MLKRLLETRTYDAHETHRMHELHGSVLASFQARALAFATDFLIANILFIPVALLAVWVLIRAGVDERRILIRIGFFDNWYSVVWLVLYFGMATFLGRGATIGKRLFGIRVVSLVHEELSLWHSIERALGYGASALELGFGFLQYFIHPNRRTVHDRIAETIVVSTKKP
ncbi:MAG TPA: RDD family protein [Thermoanaerobaculia bacterium]|nr:RDD family protein [Thermoanaerobaculia bacterium]